MTNIEIGNRLADCRNEAGMSTDDVAAITGVTKGTVSRYENGKIDKIKLPVVESIARAIGVNPAWVVGKSDKKYEAPSLSISTDAQRIGALYDRATDRDRKLVDAVLEPYDDGTINAPPPSKIIPLFGTAAAAGPGEMDTGLPFEDYEVPADSPAIFAVRVSGDSMEPFFHDGQIILGTERKPQIGEIVVVMVNGALLVKQFITDGRNIFLRSLNRKRKDCDYDIWATGNDTVNCYGTIIMKKRPPLVEQ